MNILITSKVGRILTVYGVRLLIMCPCIYVLIFSNQAKKDFLLHFHLPNSNHV